MYSPCTACSNQENTTVCDVVKLAWSMTCLILTRVVIHQLAVPWKSAILEIFIEPTSEFQTSVTFLLVNENIKCGWSFSKLDRNEHVGTKYIVTF